MQGRAGKAQRVSADIRRAFYDCSNIIEGFEAGVCMSLQVFRSGPSSGHTLELS